MVKVCVKLRVSGGVRVVLRATVGANESTNWPPENGCGH